MYYAFFAKRSKGSAELRGPKDQSYRAADYVTGKTLGTVAGGSAHLPAEFDGNLLVEMRAR
jgi:hypothetical protein